MSLDERHQSIADRHEAILASQGFSSKTALQRVQAGERSIQVIAELSALYLCVVLAKHERYDQLKRRSVDAIWARYQELGLLASKIRWLRNGKASKASMINPIVDIEFPEGAYEEALQSVGVNPKLIWHYYHKSISKAVL